MPQFGVYIFNQGHRIHTLAGHHAFIADDVSNFGQAFRLFGGIHRNAEQSVVVFIPIFHGVLRHGFNRHCHGLNIIQPENFLHTVYLADFVFIIQRFRYGNILHHDTSIGRVLIILGLHNIQSNG